VIEVTWLVATVGVVTEEVSEVDDVDTPVVVVVEELEPDDAGEDPDDVEDTVPPLLDPPAVKQELSPDVCTGKGADWTVFPVESRKVRLILEPPWTITDDQLYEVPVKPLQEKRAAPLGSLPG